MCMFSTNASFPRKAANPSAMLTRPSRIDSPRAPGSARPHSNVSRISLLVPRAAVRGDHFHGRAVGFFGLAGHSLSGILSLRGDVVRRTAGDDGQPDVCPVRFLQQFPEESVAVSARVVNDREVSRLARARIPCRETEGGSPVLRRGTEEFPAQRGDLLPPLVQGPRRPASPTRGKRSGTEPRLSVPRANGNLRVHENG